METREILRHIDRYKTTLEALDGCGLPDSLILRYKAIVKPEENLHLARFELSQRPNR